MAWNTFRVITAIGVGGVIAVILGGILGWLVVPMVIRNQIADTLPLRMDSDSWDRWQNPPVPIFFKVYIFHVENPDGISLGEVPRVTEYGPFVYREERVKEIISVDEANSTATYKQNLVFTFDQEASGNLTEDNVYTVVNLQALALAQMVYNLKFFNPVDLVNTAIPKMWPDAITNRLFMRVSVKDLLFGRLPMYCNETDSLDNIDVKVLCQAAKVINPKTVVFDDLQKGIHTFSMFRYKNNSYDGVYEVDLGLNDITKIGSIKSWNNLTELSVWKADSCNKILGTDSTIFRPYLTMDGVDSLYIFNTDACRSIKITGGDYSEYKGVPGVRYVVNEDTFASPIENHENYCYCPQSILGLTHYGGCLRTGVVELSSCHRVPIVISHPHFLMADESYQKIEGLFPEKSKHQSFLDLEPYTGTPLSGASKIQINIFLQRIEKIDLMKNFPNVLLPVVWMEESFQLTDVLIEEIDAKLLRNILIVDIVRWLVIAVGSTVTLSAVSYYFVKMRTSSSPVEESEERKAV